MHMFLLINELMRRYKSERKLGKCNLNVTVAPSLSHVWQFVTLWTAACQASLSSTVSWSLLKLMFISHWCYPTISSSFTRFLSCPKSFPASRSFPISQLFTSVGQSIGTSASASIFAMNIQGWFPLGLTGLSPCCSKDSEESSSSPQFENISQNVYVII